MLEIYKAIKFNKELKGGTTRPWQIFVHKNGNFSLVPFIFKPFSIKDMSQSNLVLKEFLGSNIAKQFDLPTPDYGLVIEDDNFFHTFANNNDLVKRHKLISKLPAFGSIWLDGRTLAKSNIQFIKNSVDVDTLFIFDMLICNTDRNTSKPNLLLSNNEIYLIDHERSFTYYYDIEIKVSQNLWYEHLIKNHLFYKSIKSRKKSKKLNFDTFAYYLNQIFRVNELDKIAECLSENGHECSEYLNIRRNLSYLQNESTKFVNAVYKMI